ncbi:MAG TPA: glycosyltransferase family 4 protein [Ktedonobacterales bacterium]
MRILYLCADFGIPVRGFKGASVHVREVASALTQLGHEVAILTPKVGEGNEVRARLIPVPAPPLAPALERGLRLIGKPFGSGKRLAREARELVYNRTMSRAATAFAADWPADCVYERYALFGLAGAEVAKRLGVPHILEVNAPLRLERQRAAGLALEWPARWLERSIFGGADRVLCVSDAMADYVRARGAPSERVEVQPNAVDVDRFWPDDRAPDLRARLGYAPGDVVIGFTGSLKPWHGVESLVEAVAHLRDDLPQARLLIVGDGPARATIERAMAEWRVEDITTLAGKVAHADIPAYLAAMDITVAPYGETPNFYFSPLKIFEYMAAGRPVVASRLGQIAEILDDKETGLLYPPGDVAALAARLRALTSHPSLRSELGMRGANKARAQYTWTSVGERITAMIHAETAKRSAPRGRSGRRDHLPDTHQPPQTPDLR